MKKVITIFNLIIESYKLHRGNDYYRVTKYALIIPVTIFATSIVDFLLKYFSIHFNIPDIGIPPIYGLFTLVIILLFYITCYFIESRYQPLNPHIKNIDEQKIEHDMKVVNTIINVIEYEYFKRKLESALNGVDWPFVDKLTELQFYLSPKYKLFNNKVEKCRIDFLIEADKFNTFLSHHLYVDNKNKDRLVIPPEWLHDSRKQKYHDHQNEISKKAHELFQLYYKFYEAAKDAMLIDAIQSGVPD